MMRYLLIFLLPLSIYASKILSYNIYDRTDRVDVMITFDTPYDGSIKQSKSSGKIIIKLEDAQIESSKRKKLSSKYITSLSITPMAGYTQIVAAIPDSVTFKASKTADSYGLRLRFNEDTTSNTKIERNPLTSANPLSNLPTKKSSDMSQSYYIVIAVLLIGIIILLYIKKKVTKNQPSSPTTNSWLFKTNDSQKAAATNINQTQQSSANNVTIRFQKNIDEKNSVVMLDFGEQSYLVLMGNSNILLDKFSGNKPTTQEDFESILQNRHEELENFLNGSDDLKTQSSYEPLESYKNKASSSIAYEA